MHWLVGALPTSVDDDVVAPSSSAHRSLLVGVAGWRWFCCCYPSRWRKYDACRRYCCCHTPARAHDSLHSFVCLVALSRLPDTERRRGLLSNLWYQRACGCLPCSQRWFLCVMRADVAVIRAVDGAAGFADCRESAGSSVRGTCRGLRGGRPRRPGSPVVLGPVPTGPPTRCEVRCAPIRSRCGDDTGWSASPGIVYAVVAAGSKAITDPSLIDECGQWTVSAGRYQRKRHAGGGARHRRRGDRGPVHHALHDPRRGRQPMKPIRTPRPSRVIWASMWRFVVVTDPGSPESSPLGQDFWRNCS